MWFFNFRSSKTRLRLNPPKVTVLTVNQYVTRKVINFHTNNSIPRYMTTNKVHDSYIILQHLNPSSHHPRIHPYFRPRIHGQTHTIPSSQASSRRSVSASKDQR